MSAQTSKSRTRGPNFSKEEQLLFLKVIESYTHIIENKKTDGVKTIVKQETWAKITEIFNAKNKNVHRTTENLISCYRNMKSKIKKQHSEAKMVLPGDGPPLDDRDPLDQLKELIEPHVDGLYTVYDSVTLLMHQESIPEKDRIMPIENNLVVAAEEENEVITGEKRTEGTYKTEGNPKKKKKKNVKESFTELSEAKLELVQLQKESLQLEIEHKKKMNYLELEEKIKENKHKDEMRQKELLLLDLKIKQLSQ